MSYTFTANYNEELAQYIDGLFSQDKAEKLSRQCRLQASDSLVESYVKHTGERPPSAQLGRLATLILRDELADPHPDKMSREEIPVLSESQSKLRRDRERDVSDLATGKDNVTIGRYTDKDGIKRRIYDYMTPRIL